MSVLEDYRRDGYVVMRGLVSIDFVDAAGRFLENAKGVDKLGQYPLWVRMAPELRVIARWLAHDALLFDLLRTEHLFCHWPPMARCVLPGNDKAMWPPHVDTQYNGHIVGDFLTVWMPLVPIDDACGGLSIDRKDLIDLVPGDGVILSNSCVHASSPNRSDRPRLNCDFRFFGEGATSTKHYLDMATDIVTEPIL